MHNISKKKSKNSGKPSNSIPAFLLKTYEILEDQQYSHIISWNNDGTAFFVKNVNEFSDQVLPRYFKHNNFSSFVRQLNMYDFHKMRHENNENEFRHHLFLRGSRNLLSEIKRKTTDSAAFLNNTSTTTKSQLNENFGQNSPEEDLYYSDEDNSQQQQAQQLSNQQQKQQVQMEQPVQQQSLFLSKQNSQYQPQVKQPMQTQNNQEFSSFSQSLAVQPNSAGALEDTRALLAVNDIKSRLSEVEVASKNVTIQNANLVRENKILWHELIKNKELHDRKIEKLVLFLFSTMKPGGVQALSTMINNSRASLTDDSTSPNTTLNEVTSKTKQENAHQLKGVAKQKEGDEMPSLLGDNELNGGFEKMLKNYPSLMQKASNTNSKVESEKLMEDYFSYLQGKEKQSLQPNGSNTNDRPNPNMNMTSFNPALNEERQNSSNSKPPVTSYLQNPNNSKGGWKEGFEMYQELNPQSLLSERGSGKPLGQSVKHQKTDPNAPNLVGNTGVYAPIDAKSNSSARHLSQSTMSDSYSTGVRNEANNAFSQQSRPGLNGYLSGSGPNYVGGSFGNPGLNGAPYVQNQSIGSNFTTGFNPNQYLFPEENAHSMYKQQGTFNPNYQTQNYNSNAQPNPSSQIFTQKLNPTTSMTPNELQRKSFDSSGQIYLNKPDQKFDFNAPLGLAGGTQELNGLSQYPYMGIPSGQPIVDFHESKKNPYLAQNNKIAQAFPNTSSIQGAIPKITGDNTGGMGNIKPLEIAEEIDKIMQDGTLNIRMSISNEFESFPKSFDEPYY